MKTHLKEPLMKGLCALCAALSILAVGLICWFLSVNGIPALQKIGLFSFLSGSTWAPESGSFGILPMIVGTLYLAAGSLLLGVPIGVLCAVFLVYYCPKKLAEPFKFVISLLAGIPSIVFGFFGLVVLVPALQVLFPGTSGKGILCASIVLSIMILPTIVSLCENALQKVDPDLYDASLALGASHDHTVFFVCLPAAFSGILAAAVLGLGRAIGETMAVIMVAGNAAVFPNSLLTPMRTLTTNIVMEMSYASGLHREALIATALVLFVLILMMNTALGGLKRKERSV